MNASMPSSLTEAMLAEPLWLVVAGISLLIDSVYVIRYLVGDGALL